MDGECDCIKDGTGQCIASPPKLCVNSPDEDPCRGGQICDARYDHCACPSGTVLLSSKCVETVPTDGGAFFDCKWV